MIFFLKINGCLKMAVPLTILFFVSVCSLNRVFFYFSYHISGFFNTLQGIKKRIFGQLYHGQIHFLIPYRVLKTGLRPVFFTTWILIPYRVLKSRAFGPTSNPSHFLIPYRVLKNRAFGPIFTTHFLIPYRVLKSGPSARFYHIPKYF